MTRQAQFELLNQYTLVLGSQSPRRKMLFEGLGFPFEVRCKEIDESFSPTLTSGDIPSYLAKKKADAMRGDLVDRELLVTADTIVWKDQKAINKPENKEEAVSILTSLSGQEHSVFTGVCLTTTNFQSTFVEETKVYFNTLSAKEIEHYLEVYNPYDKAGGYGIQEFIGLIGIHKITGDFYNVVGFPMQRFWRELALVPPAQANR